MRVRSDAAESQLRRQWARCLDDEAPASGEILAADSPWPLPREILLRLTHTLTTQAMDDLQGRALLWHAAGVSDRRGRVVALLAPGGTGKTTASIVLGRHGWGYVTDETVAVLPDGQVVPFPKPLSVRDDPVLPELKTHQAPDDLGLAEAVGRLCLAKVVILDRLEHGTPPVLERLPPIAGLRAVIQNSSGVEALNRPLTSLCTVLERAGGVFTLRYQDIGECLTLVREAVSTSAPWPWQPIADLPGGVDAVLLEDRALAMKGTQLWELGPAAAITLAFRDRDDLTSLTDELQRQLGPTSHARDVAAATLAELRRLRLVAP